MEGPPSGHYTGFTRMYKVERRREPRESLSGALLVLVHDSEGRERVSRAECIDVSPSGLRLRVTEKPALRANVNFNSRELGIAGRGTVRFAIAKKAAFEIGLECTGGTGWKARAESLTRQM